MLIQVDVLVGNKEWTFQGNASIFDNKSRDYLEEVGFWLYDWKHPGKPSKAHTGPVFIPWLNCGPVYTIEEVKRVSITAAS